jgi:hypothetical protein
MQRMMVFKSGHARLLYKPLKIDQDQAFGELNGGSGHRGAAQTSFLPGVSLQALPYGADVRQDFHCVSILQYRVPWPVRRSSSRHE